MYHFYHSGHNFLWHLISQWFAPYFARSATKPLPCLKWLFLIRCTSHILHISVLAQDCGDSSVLRIEFPCIKASICIFQMDFISLSNSYIIFLRVICGHIVLSSLCRAAPKHCPNPWWYPFNIQRFIKEYTFANVIYRVVETLYVSQCSAIYIADIVNINTLLRTVCFF